MPFTGSHAAAILPFARRRLPASALVIGTMSPDLPYYLPVSAVGSHTLLGLVVIDLPLGLLAFVVWQAFVGRAVVALAPAALRPRLAGYPVGLRPTAGTARRSARVIAAMLLGGLTHLAWDTFTHRHGWVYDHAVWLRSDHGPLPGYRWVHLASEIVAVVALTVWLRRWWRLHPTTHAFTSHPGIATRALAWSLVVVAAGVGAVQGVSGTDKVAFYAVAGAGSWGGAALVAVAALWTIVQRRSAAA